MKCTKCGRGVVMARKSTISPLGSVVVVLFECPKCNNVKIGEICKIVPREPSRDIKLGKAVGK